MRDFARGASNQELGMQAVELVGEGEASKNAFTAAAGISDQADALTFLNNLVIFLD